MDPTAFDLFGTMEPQPDRRLLRAGPLAAVLEGGQLRDIRWQGVEALRAIAYLLRDSGWGTLPVALSDLEVREEGQSFAVTYMGWTEGPAGAMTLRARIDGTAEGELVFEVEATAGTDFTTNRTGFVVLHPEDVAGKPLRVGHTDGRTEATALPERISPDQPAFDILWLEHEPAPGVTARVAFDGGIWEMEDQRNWSDASFKTYVRPLAWPFPYVISAGTTVRQRVLLRVSGQPRATSVAPRRQAASVRTTMPPVYLRLAEGEPTPWSLPLPSLAQGLIVRLRPGCEGAGSVAKAAALAAREGMSMAVEAIFPQRDPEAEAAACLAALKGHPVAALLVAAQRDLRTRPSGSLPEGEAPLEATVAALRRGGFAGRIGTGVPSFFTEFNRNPPPPSDFAFFGICPIVHAADDLSVMETLRVVPAIMQSAAALVPGVGLWPGPLAIAPPVNPYGPGLTQADGMARLCLASRDPRHGALFGAAHLLAAVAATLPGAEALAPLHANGPAGSTSPEGGPLPLTFVLAELARAEGAALVPLAPSAPAAMAALAWEHDGRRTVLLANTSPEAAEFSLPPLFTSADLLAPGLEGWTPLVLTGETLPIGPYRTLRLRGPAEGA